MQTSIKLYIASGDYACVKGHLAKYRFIPMHTRIMVDSDPIFRCCMQAAPVEFNDCQWTDAWMWRRIIAEGMLGVTKEVPDIFCHT